MYSHATRHSSKTRIVLFALLILPLITGSNMAQETATTTCVENCSDEMLIERLGANRFITRRLASQELLKRDFVNLDLLVRTLKDADCERRVRAKAILNLLCIKKWQTVVVAPQFEVKVSNPRFWEGNNPHLGGVQDYSLDSNLELKTEDRIEAIISPVMIVSAMTDRRESLGTQVWDRDWGGTSGASLYLNQPKHYFEEVRVELLLHCKTSIDETFEIPITASLTQLRPEITWIEIQQVEANKQHARGLLVCVTDLLGRLPTPQSHVEAHSRIKWEEEEVLKPQHLGIYNAYRQRFILKQTNIAALKITPNLTLELKSGPVILTSRAHVVIPRPSAK